MVLLVPHALCYKTSDIIGTVLMICNLGLSHSTQWLFERITHL